MKQVSLTLVFPKSKNGIFLKTKERIKVLAWTLPLKGLFVHRAMIKNEKGKYALSPKLYYVISHKSGYKVASFKNKSIVQVVNSAIKHLSHLDWDKPIKFFKEMAKKKDNPYRDAATTCALKCKR